MKGDHMGTDPTHPSPRELPLSNQTRFNGPVLRVDAAHRAPAPARYCGGRRHCDGSRLSAGGECDLAIAGSDARFATPGVHIGLFCSTPMVALPRNLARKHAMEMLLLGEMVS